MADDLKIHPWEPEETIGTLWHRFVTKDPAEPFHEESAVPLDAMHTRISLLFRGLGGAHGTEIGEAAESLTEHRRSFWRRVGHGEEKVTLSRFDGERLGLPPVIGVFADRDLNTACFIWLAAYAAHDPEAPDAFEDPLRSDLERLRHIHAVTQRVLKNCSGLRPIYQRLRLEVLGFRKTDQLPETEWAVESVIRALLADEHPEGDLAQSIFAYVTGQADVAPSITPPKDYQRFRSIAIWPERVETPELSERTNRDGDHSGAPQQADVQRRQAKRKKSDQANRRDSLILNRFETILSWADFLNVNRRIEDDDEASARKAAEDANEIATTDVDQRPATRLAFDLDLAPQDIDRTKLAAEITYPEWDYRGAVYLADHASILASEAESGDPDALKHRDAQSQRRIRAVRRQFEALRPRRVSMPRQADGDELDIDAVVRSQVDIQAGGTGSGRVYMRTTNAERDLAVATLIDTSRSTESAVGERTVIDIARESLIALGHGLQATGDRHAIYAFSSLRRERVFVNRVKAFDETMGAGVEARISALRPGFYTRLGAAMRHTASELLGCTAQRRLMLVLTDGKPNDLDHYEGRYGIEDSRMAVQEARRNGLAVFAVTIDKRAEQYIPRIFGENGYAILPRPEKLTEALPQIYRHLIT